MIVRHGLCFGILMLTAFSNQAAAENYAGQIVQYGKMHEVVGKQQHQGRIRFGDLIKRPHFFGVAALEQLQGEATIFDGKVTITTLGADGKLRAVADSADKQAALLIGAYVDSWSRHTVSTDIEPDDFDSQLGNIAAAAGVDIEKPFPFVVEGEFTDVRLHVINGACPMRARMKKTPLPPDKQPFEDEMTQVRGQLVGIFAKDAVGDITHPATSVHMHLLYKDPVTGALVTGHVEQVAIKRGAVLRLPE